MIRVLIVDDEPHARSKMRALLAAESDVEIVGECEDGREAVRAIRRDRPDLVFLDVQMPRQNGFDVVREIGVDSMPAIVFATAYDEFAVAAFEAHALDYLLKPVEPERLGRALDRVREWLSRGNDATDERLRALIAEIESPPRFASRFAVKSGGRIDVVRADDIDWIEADGNYVTFHVGARTHLLRESLGAIEARLDPSRFARIHRSYIVNLDRVDHLEPDRHGDHAVVMRDGARLTLTRTYRDAFLARFEAGA